MASRALYHRFAETRLLDALTDSPIVLIHGPRQCGKTTLMRMIGDARGYTYFNFDDGVVRSAAEGDPLGFVMDLPPKVILDEVQHVPELFRALKSRVDRERVPGQFLLIGSANVLLLPRLADSLAGRMALIRLFPMAQSELGGRPTDFLARLFRAQFKMRRVKRLGIDLAQRIISGGYPAALIRTTARRRTAWYRDYIETIVQRDVRDLARIGSLDIMPRLLALTASQSARLLNITDLAGPFQVSRPTIRDYVTLLERVFLLEELPPWHSNRLSRLIKTPKLHMADTGTAAAILGLDADALMTDRMVLGQLLETFVYQELRRHASWREDDIRFHHFRDKDGYEVDIVLERGARDVAGIEVKAAATVTAADFRGLRKLAVTAGDKFRAGVVLYDGEASVSFGNRMYAVPVRTLWEPGA
ncbi:MAG: ATP-binding protein [Nitrospira sp.]|nr:ATP-binding protein [Nitrospira sp.]MBH0183314.1 ATP-binding protein [Nitrospira sp.]MBH0186890.1 ATP-binding protein [Nitrospira sp.]